MRLSFVTLFSLLLGLGSSAQASLVEQIKDICITGLRGNAPVEAPSKLSVQQKDYVARLRAEIARITATPTTPFWFDGVLLSGWSRAEGGGCEPLSFQLLKALESFPNVKYRTVENHRPIRLLDGEKLNDYVEHSFLSDSSFGAANEILIDPTYLQFLHEGTALGLPPIFIGTRAELEAIFTRFSGNLKKQRTFRRFSNIDVSAYAQKLYGYGRAARDRMTQDRFAGPERSVYP